MKREKGKKTVIEYKKCDCDCDRDIAIGKTAAFSQWQKSTDLSCVLYLRCLNVPRNFKRSSFSHYYAPFPPVSDCTNAPFPGVPSILHTYSFQHLFVLLPSVKNFS